MSDPRLTTSEQRFARDTGAITVRRWRIGAALYLIFTAIGGAAEWGYYPARASALLVSFGVQVLVVATCSILMRRMPTHPQAAWLALGAVVLISVCVAVYNASVGGDMLYVLLIFAALMLVSSVFVPWGAWFQMSLNAGVIAAYGIGVGGGGHAGPVPAYDYMVIAATAVFSTLGAYYIDQYHRQLFGQAAELQEANLRLQRANQARTELLSGLSHDMRTPLNVLVGYSDLLSESPALSDELRGPLRSIRREVGELISLVDGVLDLAQLEAGRLPFERGSFHLAEVLAPLRETTEEMLSGGNVCLCWDISQTLVLDSDARKVREIVRNLLSNAVKYTAYGEIRLVAMAVDGGVEVAVADTGVGVAADQQEAIFRPFHRIGSNSLNHRGGIGFGLYLVRILTDLTGGRLVLESAPGAGSTFRVWFPPYPPTAGS